MRKLLILNCTFAKSGIERLNKLLISIFEKYDIDLEIYHLTDTIEDLYEFSHLIISGSALFATQENENDKKLYDVIQQFTNKRILSICYGHQILAKALMKKNVCRKSSTPELGWRKVELATNSLFEGISNPVFYESHLEEVFDLNDDFTIIASNSNCDIQGYQYKDLPIWGVQFHPEVTFEFGKQSIKNKLANNESMRKFFNNELNNPEYIEQNFKIFENFIKS
ncbi:MAG: hypothetical protein KAS53_09050 [Candidatus Cloacimonetes bacterium]|nr:hypothetical protein [Candidatus Cloacimonadota bacterium]